MGKSKVIAFAAILMALPSTSFADGLRLEWKVDQPFRFLKYPSDMLIHEMAWEAIKENEKSGRTPVSAMQAKLASEVWWGSKNEAGTPLNRYYEAREKERVADGRGIGPLDVRQGWSSLARTSKRGDIAGAHCWNSNEQVYRGCESDAGGIKGGNEYVLPKRHIISLSASGLGSDGSCRVEVIRGDLGREPNFFGILDGVRPSRSKARAALEVEDCSKGVKAQLKFRESYRFAITFTSGRARGRTVEEAVQVQDKLIVSIGDSFASGEGNPDVPVELYRNEAIAPYTSTLPTADSRFGLPYRNKASGTYAKWLDQRCHRSMYAPPTRAAIALAFAGTRHHAITFVTYACSGAEITNGLFWPQDGVECSGQPAGRSNQFRFMEPQISAVVDALGSGANYSNYQAASLGSKDRFRRRELRDGQQMLRLGPQARGRANLAAKRCRAWPGAVPRGFINAQPRLRRSPFVRDIDALWLSIGGNDMGFAEIAARAVLDPAFTDNAGLNEITYELLKEFLTTRKLELNKRWTDDLPGRLDLLTAGIEDKLEVAPEKVLWTSYPSPFSDENGQPCGPSREGANVTALTGYRDSGPQAREPGIDEARAFFRRLDQQLERAADTARYTWVNSHEGAFRRHGVCAWRNEVTEQVDLPRKRLPSGSWANGFDPSDLKPYANRGRYFRTLNDAYLLTHGFKRNRTDPPSRPSLSMAQYMATRAINGAFHVTAQGNAHTADAIFCASLPVLFRDGPEADRYLKDACR